MKLTRKLIPAFAMLLVSAVLMSTASFAWFAMNTTVNATGMEVKAKADNIFLEIKGKQDTAWSTTGKDMADDADAAALYPSAHKAFSGPADAANSGNWYYKHATKLDAWEEVSGEGTPLTSGFAGYVYTTTFTVRLNPNMMQSATNLRVSGVNLPEDTGISLVVASDEKVVEFKADYSNINAVAENLLLDAMTNAEETITVYIYIDGNNNKVYTDNVATLFGDVSFTLAATAAST